VARGVALLDSSAQHPVGYSILASYFRKPRCRDRAEHKYIDTWHVNRDTLATALLLFMSWRAIFMGSLLQPHHGSGLFLLFRDYGRRVAWGLGGLDLPGLQELTDAAEESQ